MANFRNFPNLISNWSHINANHFVLLIGKSRDIIRLGFGFWMGWVWDLGLIWDWNGYGIWDLGWDGMEWDFKWVASILQTMILMKKIGRYILPFFLKHPNVIIVYNIGRGQRTRTTTQTELLKAAI
ncbi:hypothetical protein RhiirA1_437118 [Rhizophagus irregularis]|uniref:Uncharacterized protein n=1 Tax=Rhizophagus irregularis TaxID=588596 RepID=A0A2N0SF39_9GLOM|nr:hypothetical protein RhiirA1_437118 [Rhizophagus irregularis]